MGNGYCSAKRREAFFDTVFCKIINTLFSGLPEWQCVVLSQGLTVVPPAAQKFSVDFTTFCSTALCKYFIVPFFITAQVGISSLFHVRKAELCFYMQFMSFS